VEEEEGVGVAEVLEAEQPRSIARQAPSLLLPLLLRVAGAAAAAAAAAAAVPRAF
jgi:hypothetical protein